MYCCRRQVRGLTNEFLLDDHVVDEKDIAMTSNTKLYSLDAGHNCMAIAVFVDGIKTYRGTDDLFLVVVLQRVIVQQQFASSSM